MDIPVLAAAYTAPKVLTALAAKFGLPTAALNALTAIAPSAMSYTFFACVTDPAPKIASLFMVPTVGFTVLAFGSMGPSSYVIKNLLLPTVAGFAAYMGWLPASTVLPAAMADYVKACSVAAVAVLVALHVLHCGRAVAVRMVYPAPIIAQIIDLNGLRAKALNRNGVSRAAITSSKSPGAVIDALVYNSPPGSPTAEHIGRAFPHCWVIYVGNGEVAEVSIDAVRVYAQSLGANGIVFNPRGVGASGGVPVSTADELIDDTLDVIKFLMEKHGAKEEQIALFGHSIGGGIAGTIAAKHHRNVSVILDRTFSSLYDAARTMMPGLPGPLVKTLLPVFFGEFPTATNWNSIWHNRKCVSFHAEDQIIKYAGASLARLPRFQPQGEDAAHVIELSGRSPDPHNAPTEFFGAGHAEILRRMAGFFSAHPQ